MEERCIVIELRTRSAIQHGWRLAAIVLVCGAAIAASRLQSGQPGSGTMSAPGARQHPAPDAARPPLPPIPDARDKVYETDVVRVLYEFVANNSQIARYMPCFCSCGQRHGHESVEACYIKKRGADGSVAWSDHAMQCTICMDVIRMAKQMHERGVPVDTIRRAVEKEYAGSERRTPTPWPPKSH